MAALSAKQPELEMKDGNLQFNAAAGTGAEVLLVFGPLYASLYVDGIFHARERRPAPDAPYNITFPTGVLFEPHTPSDGTRILEELPLSDEVTFDRAQCALLLNAPEDAIALAQKLSASAEKTELLGRAVRQAFAHTKQQAMDNALAGEREAALTRMSNITDLYSHLPHGITTPQNPAHLATHLPTHSPHVAIIGDLSLPQCKHYRVDQKVEQLQSLGLRVSVFSRSDLEAFKAATSTFSHVICYRLPLLPAVYSALMAAKSSGITVFYETDDLLFDSVAFPGPRASYGLGFKDQEYAELLILPPLYLAAMRLCDGVITSTPTLRDAILTALPGMPVHIHANALGAQHRRAQKSFSVHNSHEDTDTVNLFYGSGTRALQSDFTDFAESCLVPLFQTLPNIHLTLAGYLDLPPALSPFSHRIARQTFTDLADYWDALAAADINLAPLSINRFNHCKSAIKWLEAAMFSVPTVASATAGFSAVITRGETGMLCESAEGWQAAITGLANNRSLRSSIGAAAKVQAERDFSERRLALNLAHILDIPAT
ncbi:glycosyltransferase [Kordiimonas sp.]|uniref:glycosyltransferase n=1 Tax=Kordiimonas sp. TaxID=1970157 RepID=UPI003A8F4134